MPFLKDDVKAWSDFKNRCVKTKNCNLKNISDIGKKLLSNVKQRIKIRNEIEKDFDNFYLDTNDFVLEKDKTLGIDKLSDKKLIQGKYKIDYKLDLHGSTLDVAYNKVKSVFALADKNNFRCLLIITGKGLHSSNKTIRESLEEWFKEPYFANRIIKYVNANKFHGGSGAVYVLLRNVDKY